jgi:hypothetical protein
MSDVRTLAGKRGIVLSAKNEVDAGGGRAPTSFFILAEARAISPVRLGRRDASETVYGRKAQRGVNHAGLAVIDDFFTEKLESVIATLEIERVRKRRLSHRVPHFRYRNSKYVGSTLPEPKAPARSVPLLAL